MMSLSGAYVDQTTGMPPLADIAVGLARIPRFGGQTVISWTVAEHLLAGMAYAAAPELQLYFGLHDVHEAMTSDVPTTFKTDDLRKIQASLDARLYASLGIPAPDWRVAEYVALLDRDMLLAEASVVCPPATYGRIVAECGGREATLLHRVAVQTVLADPAPPADAWLTKINTLLGKDKK